MKKSIASLGALIICLLMCTARTNDLGCRYLAFVPELRDRVNGVFSSEVWSVSLELVRWWGEKSEDTVWASGLDQMDAFELQLRSSGFFSVFTLTAVWLWVSVTLLCHPFSASKQTKPKTKPSKKEEGYLPKNKTREDLVKLRLPLV